MHARAHVAVGAGVAAIALVAVGLFGFGPRLGAVLAGLADARPAPLWFAGIGFALALICSAGAWRSAFGRCGACIDGVQAASWYGAGSLANSLAPARVGDVVRATLFARSLDGPDRAWTAAGALAAVGAARTVVLVLLVAVGTAAGLLPLWPLVALTGVVAVVAVVCLVARRSRLLARIHHLVRAARAFPRSPFAAAALVLWAGGATAAKLAATTAVAYGFGIHSPFAVALVIVPTLELAALAPVTPGNVGVASGAITVALRSRGVALDSALTLGIAVHAVELLAGLSFGLLSTLVLTGPQVVRENRWKVATVAVAVCAAATGALAATTLVDLS